MRVCVCECMCVCACIHTHTYACIYIYINTYTYLSHSLNQEIIKRLTVALSCFKVKVTYQHLHACYYMSFQRHSYTIWCLKYTLMYIKAAFF